jgi:gamma-glutamyltranspeptidase/glutathione hydrolase
MNGGGNAVDGAVAAALASCVADPCNTGIGGYGGYMTLQQPDGTALCVQFPLWAPGHMRPDDLSRVQPDSGPPCSVVPNVIGGLARALKEFGRLTWAEVSEPAIALAHKGVVANGTTQRAFELHRYRAFMAECFEFSEGAAGQGGLVFRQPRLVATLEAMAEHGPDWFYLGPLGELADQIWREAGVSVRREDWLNQAGAVEVGAAARYRIGPLTVWSSSLDLSGSATLFAILAAAHRVSLNAPLEDPSALPEVALGMARIWEYRSGFGRRTDFSDISVEDWIDAALAHRGAPRSPIAGSGHTAHLNAADADGMLVAVTFTHGPAWFGGRWALPGTGVVMNGGMHNFTRSRPVERNGRLFGLSNMAPAVAEVRGGRIAIGCPGARRIPSNIALVLARHTFAGCNLQEAVSRGRLHAESTSRATFETSRLGPAVQRALRARFAEVGYENWEDYFGPLSALSRAPDGCVTVAIDDRETPGYWAGSL